MRKPRLNDEDMRYSMLATERQILDALECAKILRPWDMACVRGFVWSQAKGKSLIEKEKLAYFSGNQWDADLDRAREAISTLQVVLPRIRNSHAIAFRSSDAYPDIDLFLNTWRNSCDQLQESLVDIPSRKSKNKYSHIVATSYYTLFVGITGIDKISANGPAGRFVHDLMERSALFSSNRTFDIEAIEKAVRRHKAKLGKLWPMVLNSTVSHWRRHGDTEIFAGEILS